jgi:hypothetical protein
MDETGTNRIEKKSLAIHDGKRQFMAPGGQLMAQNDRSWGISANF